MSNFFQIENLNAGYGKEFNIRNINFSINKGCFTGIIGPNGSGKTTLFKTITGDLECKEGRIALNKKNLRQTDHREKAQCLAIVMQNLDKVHLKVEDYVLMGRYPYHKPFQFFETKADIEIAGKYMELTGISHLKDKSLDELSGGELQLAAIARALTQEPELLLLDEPTSHLDIKHQVRVLNLIQKLNSTLGLTVMMIIHDLNLASEYCENLILMKSGKLFAQGSPEEVLTYKNIESVYETIVVTKKNPVSGKPIVMLVSENSLERVRYERSFSI
jgi:iron complex transport system ATP-binding protein